MGEEIGLKILSRFHIGFEGSDAFFENRELFDINLSFEVITLIF